MKVKIIEERNPYRLEEEINEFIERMSDHRFVDIKYSTICTPSENYYYSAIIVYKEPTRSIAKGVHNKE